MRSTAGASAPSTSTGTAPLRARALKNALPSRASNGVTGRTNSPPIRAASDWLRRLRCREFLQPFYGGSNFSGGVFAVVEHDRVRRDGECVRDGIDHRAIRFFCDVQRARDCVGDALG